jgi:hypothetical protein
MKRICNLTDNEQLSIIEKVAHNLQGVKLSESVEEVLVKVLNSKAIDITDSLIKTDMNAFDYGKDSRKIVMTIVKEVMKNKFGLLMSETVDEALEEIEYLLDFPDESSELRFCDKCGSVMDEGFCIGGGEEYYCSSECLHKVYTEGEYLAMYAGLDNTDQKECEKALSMTPEELDKLSEENDSQTYFTSWEYEK